MLSKNDEASYSNFVENSKSSSVQTNLDWRNLVHELDGDIPYFLVAKQNRDIVGVLPLYFSKNKFGNILTSSVWHTISGILCSVEGRELERVYKKLLDYSVSLAKELDCVLLSIGGNPFVDDKSLYLNNLQPDYVLENFVQYICLSEIYDEMGKLVHPNYVRRTNLSKNLAKLSQLKVSISEVQSQQFVDQAFALQEKRLKELGGRPFPKEFLDSVLKNITLKDQGRFLFAFHEEKMISTCLFLSNKHRMDAFMMCMDSDFSHLRPNFALTKYMLDWAQKRTIPIFHWMSSSRNDDGVYRFKEQWGSHEGTFLYLTKILGDISSWRKMSFAQLNEAYEFHYLLPFNLLCDSQAKFTTKNDLTEFMASFKSKS